MERLYITMIKTSCWQRQKPHTVPSLSWCRQFSSSHWTSTQSIKSELHPSFSCIEWHYFLLGKWPPHERTRLKPSIQCSLLFLLNYLIGFLNRHGNHRLAHGLFESLFLDNHHCECWYHHFLWFVCSLSYWIKPCIGVCYALIHL